LYVPNPAESFTPAKPRTFQIILKTQLCSHIFRKEFYVISYLDHSYIFDGLGCVFWQKRRGLGSNSIRKVLVDKNGNIFAATSAGLAISRDGGESYLNYTTNNGLGSNDVKSVAIGPEGNIYVATNNGVAMSSDGGNSYTNSVKGLVSPLVHEVFVGSSGRVFVGTNSAMSWSQDQGESYTTLTLGGYTVRAIFVDQSGVIYSGRDAAGLVRSF
jgi:ligand-binding sensor domain-containing protein